MIAQARQAAIDAAFELWGEVEERMQPPDHDSPDYYSQLVAQRITCATVTLTAIVILAEHWAAQRQS